MTTAKELADRMEDLPQLIRLYPTPWHVTMDGIKTDAGIWVMTATNSLLSHQIVALANYAGEAAARLRLMDEALEPFAEVAEEIDGLASQSPDEYDKPFALWQDDDIVTVRARHIRAALTALKAKGE